MDKVEIRGLRSFAFHGCHEAERRTGGVFLTNVVLFRDNSRAAASDKIEDAADYVEVMELVKEVMSSPKNLIETVAEEVAVRLLGQFQEVAKVEVEVQKLSPPIDHSLDYVSATTIRERKLNN